MPVKSAKQYGFMQMHAHGAVGGPSEAVAKEMVHKTSAIKRSKFASALMKKRKKD